jgi:hypothetical protein
LHYLVEDPSQFEAVKIDPRSGAPIWPGDLDVAPDRLYLEVTRGATAKADT